MRKASVIIAIGLGLAVLFPQAGAAQDRWGKIVAEAKREGKVVVSGPPIRELNLALVDGFQKAYGINVEYLALGSGEISVRVEKEAAAGKISIDSYMGGAASQILVTLPKGLLEPLADQLLLPEVKDASKWRGGKHKWVDGKKQHVLQIAEYVFGGLLVNTNQVKPEQIYSWKDLLKPEWKGKLAAYEPRTPGPGNAVARYLLDRFGEEYVVKLYQGQDVKLTRDLRQIAEWVARGTYPISLGAVPTEIERFRREGFPLAVSFPKDGPGSLVGGYGTIVMFKGAPHPNAAITFINWFASKEGQELYAKAMLEPSLRTDVPTGLVPDFVLPQRGVIYDVDQYSEKWILEVGPKAQQRLINALGR